MIGVLPSSGPGRLDAAASPGRFGDADERRAYHRVFSARATGFRLFRRRFSAARPPRRLARSFKTTEGGRTIFAES